MSLTNRITKCCSAEVVRHTGKEFPDGKTFFISTSWDACNKCGDEWPETVTACDVCGEGNEHLIDTILGDICKVCVSDYADELVIKA